MTGGFAGPRWRLTARVVWRGLRLPAQIYFEPDGFVSDVGAVVPGEERLTLGEAVRRARTDPEVQSALLELAGAALVAMVWAALLCAALDVAGVPVDWTRAAGIVAVGVVAGLVVGATVEVAVGIAVGVGLALAGGVAGGATGWVAGEIAVGLAIGLAAGVGLGLAYRIDARLAVEGPLAVAAGGIGAMIGAVACVAHGILAGGVLALAVPAAAAATALRPGAGAAARESIFAWLERASAAARAPSVQAVAAGSPPQPAVPPTAEVEVSEASAPPADPVVRPPPPPPRVVVAARLFGPLPQFGLAAAAGEIAAAAPEIEPAAPGDGEGPGMSPGQLVLALGDAAETVRVGVPGQATARMRPRSDRSPAM
jgi:hypothetical protein